MVVKFSLKLDHLSIYSKLTCAQASLRMLFFINISGFKSLRKKLAPVASQHQSGGGRHGKEELVFRIVADVL